MRPCDDLNTAEGLEQVILDERHGSCKANLGDAHSPGSNKEDVVVVTREIRNKDAPKIRHESAKPVGSILPMNSKLSLTQCLKIKIEKVEMIKIRYASAVESLMYAMVCTKPPLDMLSKSSTNT